MAGKPDTQPRTRVGLKQRSAPTMIYLAPQAAKALKVYAAQHDTKVHDLLVEAIEDWFRGHDLKEPVRVI